jgi:hypothetical protein
MPICLERKLCLLCYLLISWYNQISRENLFIAKMNNNFTNHLFFYGNQLIWKNNKRFVFITITGQWNSLKLNISFLSIMKLFALLSIFLFFLKQNSDAITWVPDSTIYMYASMKLDSQQLFYAVTNLKYLSQ